MIQQQMLQQQQNRNDGTLSPLIANTILTADLAVASTLDSVKPSSKSLTSELDNVYNSATVEQVNPQPVQVEPIQVVQEAETVFEAKAKSDSKPVEDELFELFGLFEFFQ
jgi:hypothetical protein